MDKLTAVIAAQEDIMNTVQFPSKNERRFRRLKDRYQVQLRRASAALIALIAAAVLLGLAYLSDNRHLTFFFLVWFALGSWALIKGYSQHEIRDMRLFGAYFIPPFIVFVLPLVVIFRVWRSHGLKPGRKMIWLAWAWLKAVLSLPQLMDVTFLELKVKYKQNTIQAKLARIADWLYSFSWEDSTDDPGNRRHRQ